MKLIKSAIIITEAKTSTFNVHIYEREDGNDGECNAPRFLIQAYQSPEPGEYQKVFEDHTEDRARAFATFLALVAWDHKEEFVRQDVTAHFIAADHDYEKINSWEEVKL